MMSNNTNHRTPRSVRGHSIKPQNEHERLIRRLMKKPSKEEALEWLAESGRERRRTLGEFTSATKSKVLVTGIYGAGATKVLAVDIKADSKGNQRTGKLIVALPKNAEARETIFKWCKKQGNALGFSPERDGGEKYLFLLLD